MGIVLRVAVFRVSDDLVYSVYYSRLCVLNLAIYPTESKACRVGRRDCFLPDEI
jgi:hypothetical protein